MAKAPTTKAAKARAAFVLGRITRSQYAECVIGNSWIRGAFLFQVSLSRRGRIRTEVHPLPKSGTHRHG